MLYKQAISVRNLTSTMLLDSFVTMTFKKSKVMATATGSLKKERKINLTNYFLLHCNNPASAYLCNNHVSNHVTPA
jgi:hypothetical protein